MFTFNKLVVIYNPCCRWLHFQLLPCRNVLWDLGDNLDHYSDVIMGAMASQTTGLTIVYLTVCSSADQRKHQSPVSLAFVRGIHRWPGNSPHKWPVTRKMLPFDDVIMLWQLLFEYINSNIFWKQKPKIVMYDDLVKCSFCGWFDATKYRGIYRKYLVIPQYITQ